MLVQDQEVNGGHGGHQQRKSLSLSAGETPHRHAQLVLQTQAQGRQHGLVVANAAAVGAGSQAVALSLVVRKGQVLQDGHGGAGTHSRVLIHPADAGIPPEFLHAGDVPAVHENLPVVHGDGAAQDVQQAGLAAAVAAHHGHKAALLDKQVEAGEQARLLNGAGAVGLGYIPQFKHECAPSSA